MKADRKRSVSVDLPDVLVRRAARFVGTQASFNSVVERALAEWVAREESRQPAQREAGLALAGHLSAAQHDVA